MREVICINIGQAGVQISNAVWELFCVEHSIGCDGTSYQAESTDSGDSFKTMFHEVPSGHYIPRVISVDLEPTVLDEIRTGCYRNLFHPDQLISGCEDASNNYSRGHYTVGRKLVNKTVCQIRKLVQTCEFLQGFIMINSLAGGTGSGYSTLLNEKLSIEYTKRPKFQVGVYPAPHMETCVVSPYNAVMNTHVSMDYIDLSLLMDNEAMYGMLTHALMIQRPTFTNLNRLMAQVLSSITVSLRFENCLNADIDQMCTNLIPYPRIHFPTSHYAPIESPSRAEHETIDEHELTRSVFSPFNQFIKVDTSDGKMMSCVIQYRGRVTPKSVNQAIFEIKRKHDINFVDWCPTGFKVGINGFPPVQVPGSAMAQTPRSVTMLSNTTAIAQMWTKLLKRFNALFMKRAFVFWFVGEGMEEGEFSEARDTVNGIIGDYYAAGTCTEDLAKDDADVMSVQKVVKLTPSPLASIDSTKSPKNNPASEIRSVGSKHNSEIEKATEPGSNLPSAQTSFTAGEEDEDENLSRKPIRPASTTSEKE